MEIIDRLDFTRVQNMFCVIHVLRNKSVSDERSGVAYGVTRPDQI